MSIFRLPDLGEGLPDAEIVEWHVKVGDEIELHEKLVAMETAKAIVEVPSPIAGRVLKLYGKPGDVIETGAPLIEFEIEKMEMAADKGTVVGKLEVSDIVIEEHSISLSTRSLNTVKATPAVRALAQKLKVDLGSITPTGPNAMITTQDVQQASELLSQAGQLELFKGVRRNMAQTMSQAHAEIVPVTILEDAKLINYSEKEDITVKLIQAMVAACQKEPALNAWYDGKVMGRRMMSEVHLGLAMDTEEGLFVPVIRNAEKWDATELRKQIDLYKKQVENRSIVPQDLRGATITLSNFGKFGGRYANPIVVPPMVAILGVGKMRQDVVAINGQAVVCPILPLAFSFDHRAVTGGEATRFFATVINFLESN